jgi:hypothetical protein
MESGDRRIRSARTQRRIAWPVSLLLAAGGIALAALEPGDVAYWVSEIAVLPLIAVTVIVFEDPWRNAHRGTRALVWAMAVVLALAGAVGSIVFPGARSFIIGGLMTVPLIVLLGTLGARDDDSDDARAPELGGGILGPPI